MNGRTRILLLMIGCMSFFVIPVVGQIRSLSSQDLTTVNIDEIPDAEIQGYLLKAKENGISDETMYRVLLQKGLPPEQKDKLVDRVSKLRLSGQQEETGPAAMEEKNPAGNDRRKESYNTLQRQPVISDLDVFGSEIFTSSSLVFEPNLRIPTPAGYVLGPDDELVVNVYGYSEKSYRLVVNEEGNIYIPQIGPMYVNGLSIEQASSRIRSRMAATIYRAINSGGTRVQISLGQIRSIRVTVIGAARKPGTYTVSSLTTVFNLLYLCGGPADLGSYREIELVRGDDVKRKVDLYSFLIRGSQQDNVLLREGDVIRIPYYRNRVIVNGQVKRKGKFELLDNENFNDVLNFCGGFADDAYRSGVTIYQYTDQERRIADLEKNSFASYRPRSGDSIIVGKLLARFENKLVLSGAVMRPGEFELSPGLTLRDLIARAGGVKEDVYNRRGSISRLDDNNKPEQLSFDVDSVIKGQTVMALKKNDSVSIYSLLDLENKPTINIDGKVKLPGIYPWVKKVTLKDMVLRAGGVTQDGDLRSIEIARRINNMKLTELNHIQTEIITVDLTDSLTGEDILLEPYDVVNVRMKPDYMDQRTIYLEGMVIRPGRYTLRMSGDRVSDVIARSGGFRANADTTALVIKRMLKKNQPQEEREKTFSKLLNIQQDSIRETERIRDEIYKDYEKISIDLSKALAPNNTTDNMLLEDGDILTIERNTNLIKVSGEVNYATIIPFEKGANLHYYIDRAFGFTDQASKKGVIVIYPDGKAQKVKRFLFFKRYPEIVSRCEIFVPIKSNKKGQRLSFGEWSVILSALAIISNVIINLRR